MFGRTLPLVRREPLDAETRNGVVRLYRAIQEAAPDHLPQVMEHFQRTLLPAATDLLIDHLIGVVRRGDEEGCQRAATALGHLCPAAVFPMSYQLSRTQSSAIGVRLVEALGVMMRVRPAPLPTLLHALHTAKHLSVREATRRILMEHGVQVPEAAGTAT